MATRGDGMKPWPWNVGVFIREWPDDTTPLQQQPIPAPPLVVGNGDRHQQQRPISRIDFERL